jgi:hypothetical protein
MPCACGKTAAKEKFIVRAADGTEKTIEGSEVDARIAAAKFGGGASWRKVKS